MAHTDADTSATKLHCVALASQFLWLVGARGDEPPSALTCYGLRIVHATLTDRACLGGRVWLRRAAGLSHAGQALIDAGIDAGQAAPCPELFGLLDPKAVVPKLDFDPDHDKQQAPIRTLSPPAEALGLWLAIRNTDYGHTDPLHARAIRRGDPGLWLRNRPVPFRLLSLRMLPLIQKVLAQGGSK
ncbi:hypothetical protein [uncultured Thiodictyon sp.]|jgi:hypothetical protein|uniref:hypothetical protein n=1 Tax=uncultured Thiodictyon sp. TaxID=1846217 RepID=UPI0025DCB7D0|nr:hypothetical protein [uncultured Thiodictyon sp.]